MNKDNHVFFAPDIDALCEINRPEFNISLLKRKPQSDITHLLSKINQKQFPFIDENIEVCALKDFLNKKFFMLIQLHPEETLLLTKDLIRIAEMFSKAAGSDYIRVCVECVTRNKCTLFHCDYYSLRLVTTYFGKGTVWTNNSNVNRKMLGCGDNKLIIKDQRKIKTLRPFDIAILKGETYRHNKGNGIVHRSPDIKEKEYRIFVHFDC